ncbi:type II toxin-antitoxin system antitoxin [Helicobacter pylori]
MANVLKDYSQYNERQLFNFLNALKKQMIKVETEQRRVERKLTEMQEKYKNIKDALAKKFQEPYSTENGYTQEQEQEILKSANEDAMHFNSVDDFKNHYNHLAQSH